MWGDLKEIKSKYSQYFATREEGFIEASCGPGWYMLLDLTLAFLKLLKKDFRIAQIKEKFGVLTIYVSHRKDAEESEVVTIRNILNAAAELSMTTCEFCGEMDGIDGAKVECKSWSNWRKSLCQECGPKYREGWRPWADCNCPHKYGIEAEQGDGWNCPLHGRMGG